MSCILDGKGIAEQRIEKTKQRIASLPSRPKLVTFLIGDNPASAIYSRIKVCLCRRVGIDVSLVNRSEISERELLREIDRCNADPGVHAILVQLPLPKGISTLQVIESIDPSKDVDGFHPLNLGKLLADDQTAIVPCTPLGIVHLLSSADIPVLGKRVVIVGRSQIVGKPLAALLLQKRWSASVSVVHRQSNDLATLCRRGEILVVAAGQPELIRRHMVDPESVIIDVGINRLKGKIVGDVAFAEVVDHCRAITPVPGGIGAMTAAILLENILQCYCVNSNYPLTNGNEQKKLSQEGNDEEQREKLSKG